MRSITIVLDADDTSKSVYALVQLVATRPAALSAEQDLKKLTSISVLSIYPEALNDVDAANGPARIAFNHPAVRTALTSHGHPLLPGIIRDFPGAGAAGAYDMRQTFISGKTGDVFHICYWG